MRNFTVSVLSILVLIFLTGISYEALGKEYKFSFKTLLDNPDKLQNWSQSKCQGMDTDAQCKRADTEDSADVLKISSTKAVHLYSNMKISAVNGDILEIRLCAKGQGNGKAGFYFYNAKNLFEGNINKVFKVQSEWSEYKFSFKVKNNKPENKIAFCRLFLGAMGRSDILFKDVCVIKNPAGEYPCIKTEAKPAIDGTVISWDGSLSDECWKESVWGVGFKKLGTTEKYPDQSKFAFSYDNENLYFMAVCYDRDIENIRANAKTEYDCIWKDECLELFWNPNLPDGRIGHLTVNTLGTVNFSWVGLGQVSLKTECKSKLYDNRWEIELAIPWKELGIKAPPEGTRWSVNVGRTHRHKDKYKADYSTWAYLRESKFMVPESFAGLVFTEKKDNKRKEMTGPLPESTGKTGNKELIVSMLDAHGRKDRLPRGKPFEVPRITWANPFAGKPLNVLFVLQQAQREALEVYRRLQMRKADVIFCPHAYRKVKNFGAFAFNAQEISRNLSGKGKAYDVIVVATDIGNPKLAEAVVNNVRNGSGLVYVTAENVDNVPEAFKKILPKLKPFEDAGKNYVTENIAVGGLPYSSEHKPAADNLDKSTPKAVNAIGFGSYGKGRIVNIGYSRISDGLTPHPNFHSMGKAEGIEFFDNQICNQWWENVFSLLMRSICYVGGYVPEIQISAVSEEGKILRICFDKPLKDEMEVECIWDSMKLPSRQETTGRKFKLQPGKERLEIEIPEDILTCGGVHFCHLILRNSKSGKTVDWYTKALTSEADTRISGLSSDKTRYRPGDSAELKCEIIKKNKQPEDVELRILLKDPFKRTVEDIRKTVRLEEGKSVRKISVPLKRALTSQLLVQAELRNADNKVLDTREHRIYVPKTYVHDDYISEAQLDLTHGFRNYLYPACEKLFNESGINQHGNFFNSKVFSPYPSFFSPRIGFRGFYELHHYPGQKRHGDKYQRHTRSISCKNFNDKERFGKNLNRFLSIVKSSWNKGVECYFMCDEGGLSGHGGNIPESDFCYCKTCRDNFRKYAQKLYGTIENANKEWGTDFKNWNSIKPIVLEEAWQKKDKNYSLWVDYKFFMEDFYLNAFKKIKAKADAAYPGIGLSLPNASLNFQPREALSGENYRTWAPEETFSLKYFGPISVLGYNSFSGKDIPKFSWWGYSDPLPRIRYAPWWYTFNGIRPAWAYPFGLDYSGSSMIGMLALFSWNITHTERSLALKETSRDLVRGVGKIILGADPVRRQVAMLYSQPSFYTACAEKQDGRYLASELQWRNLIRGAGYELNFIATDELAGKLHEYKVLILPYSIALSAADQNAIVEFVKSGGILFSDCIPGRFDSHGKYFNKETTIAGIIKKASGTEEKCGDYRKIKYGNGEIILTDRNPSWIKDWKLFRKFLTEKGIKSPIRSIVNSDNGETLGLFESYAFEKGNCLFYGIIGNTYGQHGLRIPLQKIPIEIKLGKKAHIYDVRKQKYLGFTDSVKTEAGLDKALFYAAMPYKIEDINLSCQFDPADRILNYEAAVETANPEDQVFRLEIYDPDGNPVPCYTKNDWTKQGKLRGGIPFALNDRAGKWKLKLIDVISGVVREKEFVVPEKAAKKGNAKHV